MKKIATCLIVLLLSLLITSCDQTTKEENVTNHPDTAVLKEDPENTLNANPVNDTVIAEELRKD